MDSDGFGWIWMDMDGYGWIWIDMDMDIWIWMKRYMDIWIYGCIYSMIESNWGGEGLRPLPTDPPSPDNL